MKKLIFLLFLSQISMAQREVKIFKIIASQVQLKDVFVKNETTGEETTSREYGYFNIAVRPQDVLSIKGSDLENKSVVVNEEDMQKKVVPIPMQRLSYLLDEVVINHRVVNNASLGLPTAERSLHSERQLVREKNSFIGNIVNAVLGKNTQLEKAYLYEVESETVDKIVSQFNEDFYTNTLNIPKEYIKAFGYYLYKNVEEVKNIVAQKETPSKDFLKLLYMEAAVNFLKSSMEISSQ